MKCCCSDKNAVGTDDTAVLLVASASSAGNSDYVPADPHIDTGDVVRCACPICVKATLTHCMVATPVTVVSTHTPCTPWAHACVSSALMTYHDPHSHHAHFSLQCAEIGQPSFLAESKQSLDYLMT